MRLTTLENNICCETAEEGNIIQNYFIIVLTSQSLFFYLTPSFHLK
jgi:hypothetical protein